MTKALLDAIKDEKEEKYGLISDDAFVQHVQVEKHRLHVPPGGLLPESNFLIGVVIAVLPKVQPVTYQLADPENFPML